MAKEKTIFEKCLQMRGGTEIEATREVEVSVAIGQEEAASNRSLNSSSGSSARWKSADRSRRLVSVGHGEAHAESELKARVVEAICSRVIDDGGETESGASSGLQPETGSKTWPDEQ
eukprot:CAMPEP_0177571662 /NCGR_PEP_ID=MMETSP0369-20130122/77563_1 /TAXON_ID=447022 ORGANISM="Scrippsiella hangoei-like, Strain SHHI-4" /NCGR_SAMPLE_ID=MMETSP0369 /ASSEMBLY_ACC=CAM_ASM_000364 /LENGTH=116 /DNA_ID=CAMNT_0019059621 /DNA_START=29 /DNA_END=380 /DNA_ORIENTATION=+